LHAHEHALVAQVAVAFARAAHAEPHAPQFCASFVTSTHDEPQSVRPVSQLVLHWPFEQTCFAEQNVAQPPQFCGSLCTFTHAAPQTISPVAQAHAPALHPTFGGHTLPHAPQFCESDFGSTHAPPQTVSAQLVSVVDPVAQATTTKTKKKASKSFGRTRKR
jgi:hypothetical protein